MAAPSAVFNAVVVDSGFIIKKTGLSHLAPASSTFYIPPEVRAEIKDEAARAHMDSLPFSLIDREPSKSSLVAVAAFARLTGDFRALSVVDLKVLALAYDVEVEGVGSADHLRKEPPKQVNTKKKGRRGKRKGKGGGAATGAATGAASGASTTASTTASTNTSTTATTQTASTTATTPTPAPASSTAAESSDDALDEDRFEIASSDESESSVFEETEKSWATLVNPKAPPLPPVDPTTSAQFFALPHTPSANPSGQFSDAESSDDDEGTCADSDCEISDEECDIYVRDPEEVLEMQQQRVPVQPKVDDVASELASDFPSLAAAATVEYESDEDGATPNTATVAYYPEDDAERQLKKEMALRTMSVVKDGKLYNSFKKYGGLVSSGPVTLPVKHVKDIKDYVNKNVQEEEEDNGMSRIIGGGGGQLGLKEEDDDGEGWVSTVKGPGGVSSLWEEGAASNNKSDSNTDGPPTAMRCACATTDFAMQNVLLQMNMKLLSVEGVEVTRTKSWVTRCGACFAVYGGASAGTKLFCGRCGSDALQRVAASVDAKTGKQKLHLSAKRKNDTRGTKFSLPKANKQNRFAGDLLLREDQLLMGAWNMKVKKGKGVVESMFGADIVDNVGLGDLSKRDDIKVAMGKQNANAAKSGRERRGKSKKSAESKACGMRRAWS